MRRKEKEVKRANERSYSAQILLQIIRFYETSFGLEKEKRFEYQITVIIKKTL